MATRTLVKTVQKPIGKNLIINGAFEINQRGPDSASATGRYTLDRWRINPSGAIVEVQQLDDGTNDEFNQFLRTIASTADNNWGPQQRIESVKTLAGKQATVSFEVRSNDSSVSDINVALNQNFGTGGSPNSPITLIQSVPVTSSFVRHTLTFDLDPITGKTIGTDNNDYLSLIFEEGDTQTGQFDLRKVKLEEGTEATEFSRAGDTLAEELRLCQRYYERILELWAYTGTATGLGATTYTFAANKRTDSSTVTFNTNRGSGITVNTEISKATFFGTVAISGGSYSWYITGVEIKAEL